MMEAVVRASQELMEPTMNFSWSDLEETIKDSMGDGIPSVDQTQDLCKELN
jgi:hypothetical protein